MIFCAYVRIQKLLKDNKFIRYILQESHLSSPDEIRDEIQSFCQETYIIYLLQQKEMKKKS